MTAPTSLPIHLWTERDLSAYVADLARMGGWMRYHTFDSRRSQHGFPDWVLVHGGRRQILYVELKGPRGKLTDAQSRWLLELSAAGADARVWRPSDLDEIEETLVRRRARSRSAA